MKILSLSLSMARATPLAGEGEMTARQISLNPASSCPRDQLWCCNTVDVITNPLIAAALVLAAGPSGWLVRVRANRSAVTLICRWLEIS
ncbi:hypothetical protein AB1N83_000281 [Pleurotus pulmonarius]